MTTYYIDPANGSNSNSGTALNDAFANFNPIGENGSIELVAGDVVKCRGEDAVGAAIESDFTATYAGSSDGDPITIEPYNDETAVIDGSQFAGTCFYLYKCQNFLVKNFVFRNSSDRGVLVKGDQSEPNTNHSFIDCTAHDNATSGFRLHGYSQNNTFRRCVAFDQNQDGDGDGFQTNDNASNNEFIDCVAHHNVDDGFDFWKTDGSNGGNTLIRCIAYGNGTTTDGQSTGNGNGYKLGSTFTSSSGGHTLKRCVAYLNQERGFDGNGADFPVELLNCTAWNNGTGFRTISDGGKHVLRNCIAYENDSGVSFEATVDDAYNTWNLDIQDPKFRSTAVDDLGKPVSSDEFLHLDSNSPAVNAGTIVQGIEYSGDSPDLGGYEFTQTSTDTTASMKYYDGSEWQPVDTTVVFQSS